MLSKTVNLRPIKQSNVIRVRTPEKAARLHERNASDHADFDYKPILKTSYDSSVYKYQKERLSKPPNPKEMEALAKNNGEVGSSRDNYHSTHISDYSVYKKKKYNELLQTTKNAPSSQVIGQDAYKSLRSTSQGFEGSGAITAERGEEHDKRNVYRRNFYVSKPFAQLNKDFKHQPLIRNAQTTSEDTPYWFQGATKFYTQDNFDLTQKMRSTQNNLPKADIFGKVTVDHPKTEYPFAAQVPSKGQRYEMNKMVIVEKVNKNDTNLKGPQVRLKWDEEPQKQRYDRAGVTTKVGNGAEPYVKKIVAKQTFDPMVAYKKVGEEGDASRLKKEKNVDWKIGHPNSEYTLGRKQRDDGFYADRKVIGGAAYQTSNFFLQQ